MTIDERLKSVESRLDALERPRAERAALEEKIIAAALQWARVSILRCYVESFPNGETTRMHIGGSDIEHFKNLFMGQLTRSAGDIVRLEGLK